MIACDAYHCGSQHALVGHLAAHRILEHGARPGQAVVDARRLFGLETERPAARMDLSGLRDPFFDVPPIPTRPRGRPRTVRPVELSDRAKVLAEKIAESACKFCVRVAPRKCRLHGGDSVENKREYNRAFMREKRSHQANPDACRYCARVAPAKCSRHGGPSHSTSYRGDRSDRAAYESWREVARPRDAANKRAQRARRRNDVAPVSQ